MNDCSPLGHCILIAGLSATACFSREIFQEACSTKVNLTINFSQRDMATYRLKFNPCGTDQIIDPSMASSSLHDSFPNFLNIRCSVSKQPITGIQHCHMFSPMKKLTLKTQHIAQFVFFLGVLGCSSNLGNVFYFLSASDREKAWRGQSFTSSVQAIFTYK